MAQHGITLEATRLWWQTAKAYHLDHPDVDILWVKRPLQDLADFPIEALAKEHDLVIIDHPAVGAAAASCCFLPMDELLPAASLSILAKQSTGRSHSSYNYQGHQWALAIDAACHVSAYRPELLQGLGHSVPQTWADILVLARETSRTGRTSVAIPLIPVDSLMCFYTLCASSGEDPFSTNDQSVVSRETGLRDPRDAQRNRFPLPWRIPHLEPYQSAGPIDQFGRSRLSSLVIRLFKLFSAGLCGGSMPLYKHSHFRRQCASRCYSLGGR